MSAGETGLRRRAAAGTTMSDGEAIRQPLLQSENGDQTSTSAVATQQAACYAPPSLLSQLSSAPLHVLWTLLKGAQGGIRGCWQLILNWLFGGSQKLSLIQEERLEQLQADVRVAFDASNPEHQDMLRELWGHAFPGEACTHLKSPRWKDMGWQGEDPGTDFRGSGFLGLCNLVSLARAHPAVFDTLLHKRVGDRATWEYPFAVAGLNLTFALAELLELQQHRGPVAVRQQGSGVHVPSGAASRAFVQLLSTHEDAFGEVHALAFRVLDREWLDMRASYMEFNQVLKKTKEAVGRALAARPATLEALRVKLGLQPL